jgi:hypothetical protein
VALPSNLHILIAIQHNAHLTQTKGSYSYIPGDDYGARTAVRRLKQDDVSALLYATLQTKNKWPWQRFRQQGAARHTPGVACGMPAPQLLPAYEMQLIGSR